jgi:hypothetical protein
MTSKSGALRPLLSEIILTGCLILLFCINLRWAATVMEREIPFGDQISRYNYESLLGFASLALCIIGTIVIWTAYKQRRLWAWFIMVVFVFVYFVPVYLIDSILEMPRVGWRWWPALFNQALDGRPLARFVFRSLIIFVAMLIALLLPIKRFFTKQAPSAGTRGEPFRSIHIFR